MLSLVLTSCAGNAKTSANLTPSTSSPIIPFSASNITSRELGSNLFYSSYSIAGDTLVALERDYPDPTRQYIVTIDLKTGIKTRLSVDLTERYISDPPSIYGNKIVWSSVDKKELIDYTASSAILPAPNYDVFRMDLATGQVDQITTEEHAQISPVFQGSSLVWLDARHAGTNSKIYDVYFYERVTGKETRITANTTASGNLGASLFGIVWMDIRNADPAVTNHAENDPFYNNDVYWYDRPAGTERRITTHTGNDRYPVVNGKSIVWLRQLAFNKANVFLYELETRVETQISRSDYAAYSPSVSGKRIVWEDARVTKGNTNNDVFMNGQPPCTDIYVYDMDTRYEARLTSSEPHKVWQNPVISGDYVVSMWSRQVGPIVYLMDISESDSIGRTRDNPAPLNYTANNEFGLSVAADFEGGGGLTEEITAKITMCVTQVARGNEAYELMTEVNQNTPVPLLGYEYLAVKLQVSYTKVSTKPTTLQHVWAYSAYKDGYFIFPSDGDNYIVQDKALAAPAPLLKDSLNLQEVIEGWIVFQIQVGSEKPLLYFYGMGCEFWFALYD